MTIGGLTHAFMLAIRYTSLLLYNITLNILKFIYFTIDEDLGYS